MHDYQVPETSSLPRPELEQLRSIAEEFQCAASQAFSTPAGRRAITRAAEKDEVATIQGMMALITSPNADANAIELKISLQMIDIEAGIMNRADPSLTSSCVPPAMATEAVADLLHKHDLPELEKLSRKAIKPRAP